MSWDVMGCHGAFIGLLWDCHEASIGFYVTSMNYHRMPLNCAMGCHVNAMGDHGMPWTASGAIVFT